MLHNLFFIRQRFFYFGMFIYLIHQTFLLKRILYLLRYEIFHKVNNFRKQFFMKNTLKYGKLALCHKWFLTNYNIMHFFCFHCAISSRRLALRISDQSGRSISQPLSRIVLKIYNDLLKDRLKCPNTCFNLAYSK